MGATVMLWTFLPGGFFRYTSRLFTVPGNPSNTHLLPADKRRLSRRAAPASEV
jgi:hypothetical protein